MGLLWSVKDDFLLRIYEVFLLLWILFLKRGIFSTVDFIPFAFSLSYYFYWLKMAGFVGLSMNLPSLFAVFLILTTGFSFFFSGLSFSARLNVSVDIGMKILFSSSYFFLIFFRTNSSVPARFKIGSFLFIF